MHIHMQVAFGSDFSEQWDDKTLGLKLTKGNGKLTFLISHTFKGVQRAFAGGPFFQVISKLHVGTEKLNNNYVRQLFGKNVLVMIFGCCSTFIRLR